MKGLRSPRRPALLLATLATACSSSTPADTGADRLVPRFDRGPVDTAPRPHPDWRGEAQPCSGEQIGKPCGDSLGSCGSGQQCVLTGSGVGFCSCPCHLDDPDTADRNEDDCPQQPTFRCALVPSTAGLRNPFCVRTCLPRLGGNDCPPPLACLPESSAALGLVEQAACIFRGCSSGADCPVRTPLPCLPGPLACGEGLSCRPDPSGGALCVLPGACDLPSGLCKAHPYGRAGARVGDPCSSDLDCGGTMHCRREEQRALLRKPPGAACRSAEECCGNACTLGHCEDRPCPVVYRNGYCTVSGCSFAASLPERACPPDSACNRYYEPGLCQRRCNPGVPQDCRGHESDRLGDYECRDWSTLLLKSKPVSLDPVCDFGPLVPCDELKSSGLTCAVFGVDTLGRTNYTHMTCRTLEGVPTSDPLDPKGFCLDDTASGSVR